MTTKTDNDQDEVEPEEELEEKLEEDSVEEEEAVKKEEAKELSPLEQLEEQIRLKDEEILKQKDTFLREKAELENFKKRLTKEKEDFVQFANERLLKELLQIEDNLERAMAAPNATLESLKEGVEMIQKQFKDFLKNQKVEAIEALGKPFDPNLHEVLNQQESEEHEENTVIEEYSKGFTLNGRILRSAKVVISKKPAEKNEDENS
ncbi:MAG: nucleotide exchange factor GrpE [Nitrospina sp.]|nr:nucleotide exchange factor GrpE [Nitrospina sp.]MDC0205927.1 nucleotide exchange factor GrpE [Nitrospinota bacterium]GIS84543.1 MAG: nucleotide exchange factor GrpE [Nitrospina sp.]|tara:strand:+ start:758 stop:1375 length:618 start_codon:yes stop_codon:yes gene_type:complete